MFGCLTNCLTGITKKRKALNYKLFISFIIVAFLSLSGGFGSFWILPLYIHNDDNSFCWLLTVLTTLIRNTLYWKLESLNICLWVHLFLILFCCCLLVSFEIMQTTHQMLALLPFILQVSCWILDQTLVIPSECFLIFHIPSRQVLAYF
jgi:hypothetical protein